MTGQVAVGQFARNGPARVATRAIWLLGRVWRGRCLVGAEGFRVRAHRTDSDWAAPLPVSAPQAGLVGWSCGRS